MKKNNVLIMAGGTGGHVIPALSVARELMLKGYQVHWLGSLQGIENDLVPDAGYPLHRISVSGLRGNGIVKLLFAPFQLVRALWQTFFVFMKVKPVLTLGMGGFASGPGGLMALLLRKPLVIHEQNAIAGMTNSLLSRFAKPLLQAFPNTFKSRKNLHTVGNPVRQSIVEIAAPALRLANRNGPLNVLVVGGSLGAVAINNVMIETAAKITGQGLVSIWHQTGKNNFANVKAGYDAAGVDDVKVSAFISNMSEAYAWADIVICRSGALTVCELMSAGLASILVPYPHAVDDHQTENGQALVRQGAAIMQAQTDFNSEFLMNQFSNLQSNRGQILVMSEAARSLAQPESAKKVANHCIAAIR